MKKQDPTKRIDYHEHDDLPRDKFPEASNVASAQECTGLMYRAPVNREELENERGLFSMAIPQEGARWEGCPPPEQGRAARDRKPRK